MAESNASLTGFTLIVSPARFKALITAFNEGRESSRLFRRWDLTSIVVRRGSCDEESDLDTMVEVTGQNGCGCWALSVYLLRIVHLVKLGWAKTQT